MDNGRTNLSREVREYRTKHLNKIASRMPSDAALILAYIYKVCVKEGSSGKRSVTGVSVASMLEKTYVKSTMLWVCLNLFEIVNFVWREKDGHSWMYFITEDGIDALSYMLSEQYFPGRKARIMSIIEHKKEGMM